MLHTHSLSVTHLLVIPSSRIGILHTVPKRVVEQGRKVHLVLNNLNTHLRSSFEEVLRLKAAASVLRRIEFHYTPTHASWLNMAEIEIGVLDRQCLTRCAADPCTLASEVAARQRRRNAARCGIEWTFPRRDAD